MMTTETMQTTTTATAPGVRTLEGDPLAAAPSGGVGGVLKFIKKISESDAAKAASFASGVYGFAQTLFGLFSEDEMQVVAGRLEKIEGLIGQGFDKMGQLVVAQANRVIENQQTIAMQQATAQAKGASRSLFEYKERAQASDLSAAGALSSVAVEFFKQQSNPFFLPGLSVAGSVRIDFHRAADADFFNDPVRKAEIAEQVKVLASMIADVRQAVTAKHTVIAGIVGVVEHRTGKGLVTHPQDGFIHRSGGHELQLFAYRMHEVDLTDETRTSAAAKKAANAARLAGIKAELDYLSIPVYENVLATWRSAAGLQTQSSVVEQVLRRPAEAQDLARGDRPLFQVVRHAAPRALASSGAALDVPAEPVDEVQEAEDVRYFLLDLLTCPEFRQHFVEPHRDDPDRIAALAVRRLFGRRITGEESAMLTGILARLGFDALAASLVFSAEYQGRYRGGFPCCRQVDPDEPA